MTEKKSDEEILFPEATVGDIIIKPWSFGILFDISDLLDQVITKIEDKDIKLEDDFISYMTMVKIFTLASEQVLKIMSITLNIEEETIKELDMSNGVKIAIIIVKQNWSVLKNEFLQIFQKPKTGKNLEKKESKKEKE